MERRKRRVLLVVSTSHIRSRLSSALNARGLEVHEAVSATDALRLLGSGLPASMVVANRLADFRGIKLVGSLGQLERTARIPIILVLEDDATIKEVQRNPLRSSVVPVIQHRSLDAMVEAICNAHEAAVEGSSEEGSDMGLQISSAEVKHLEQAFEIFDKVLDLVKRDKLPGPMMPDVLIKVRALFGEDDIPTRKVSEFVEQHQALALRLLRLANSAFYAGSTTVTTVGQALNRLGMNQSGAVLTAAAALAYATGKDPAIRAMIVNGLTRAYLVALASERIARLARYSGSRNVFTVGLLHNIGGTFLIYTVALLQDKGELEQVDLGSLETMVASRIKLLNELICDALKLPDEVKLIHSFTESDMVGPHAKPVLAFVHQGMWVADRLIGEGRTTLELDAEAEILGVTPAVLEGLNEDLPRIQNLLADYRAS